MFPFWSFGGQTVNHILWRGSLDDFKIVYYLLTLKLWKTSISKEKTNKQKKECCIYTLLICWISRIWCEAFGIYWTFCCSKLPKRKDAENCRSVLKAFGQISEGLEKDQKLFTFVIFFTTSCVAWGVFSTNLVDCILLLSGNDVMLKYVLV